MAINFPSFEDGGDPRPNLNRFIIATRDFLDELVRSGRDYKGVPLFYEDLQPPMRAAWDEARPMFGDIAERTTLGLSQLAINEHGLDGAQLKFKLRVVKFLYDRYQKDGKSALRRLIEAIDTLLKSILSALGAGEGIKEIKEYIEHSISD